jgi:hypothetical protein
MNSDYIKQLEQQIEEMQAKLSVSDATNAELKHLAELRDSENGESSREILSLTEELRIMKASYEHACDLVARMHKAATGKTCAPHSNPVADVAKLRSMYIRLKEQRHDKHRDRSV